MSEKCDLTGCSRYVHHLSQDMKDLLAGANIPIPLLSPARHGLCYSDNLDQEAERVCGAYREQVTCASCHSDEFPVKTEE